MKKVSGKSTQMIKPEKEMADNKKKLANKGMASKNTGNTGKAHVSGKSKKK